MEIFIDIEKCGIPTEIPTKEVRAEIETNPVTLEVKVSKCSL